MRIRYFYAPFAAFVLCSAAVPGAAQTTSQTPPPAVASAAPAVSSMAAPMAAAPVKASSLIKVDDCGPSLNKMQSGGFVGYAPGWIGGYWGDPYGLQVYQPPITTTSPQLAIHYTNVSSKVMKSIEFGLTANGTLLAEVKDVGTFSPGVEIKHTFGISQNVFPLRTGLPRCPPLRITFADGTKWRNPMLPPKNNKIYRR